MKCNTKGGALTQIKVTRRALPILHIIKLKCFSEQLIPATSLSGVDMPAWRSVTATGWESDGVVTCCEELVLQDFI